MTNLNSILKSRDITLLTKVYLVKVMVFAVVTRGYIYCKSSLKMGGFFLTNVKAKLKNTESVEPSVIVTVQKVILFFPSQSCDAHLLQT